MCKAFALLLQIISRTEKDGAWKVQREILTSQPDEHPWRETSDAIRACAFVAAPLDKAVFLLFLRHCGQVQGRVVAFRFGPQFCPGGLLEQVDAAGCPGSVALKHAETEHGGLAVEFLVYLHLLFDEVEGRQSPSRDSCSHGGLYTRCGRERKKCTNSLGVMRHSRDVHWCPAIRRRRPRDAGRVRCECVVDEICDHNP